MIYSVRHIDHVSLRTRGAGECDGGAPAAAQRRRAALPQLHLDVDPPANIMQYRDFTGNTVHHFDIAGKHTEVKVTAQSAVEVQARRAALRRHRRLGRPGRPWSRPTARLLGNAPAQPLRAIQRASEQLAGELGCERRGNPLELLTELNEGDLQFIRLCAEQHESRFAD